jgi:hypothetical protein
MASGPHAATAQAPREGTMVVYQPLGDERPPDPPVPSIDHDHTVSSAQEEQSEHTPAPVAPEEESAARKTGGVGTSGSPLVVAGIDGSAESLAAARYADAAAEV